MKKNLKKIIKEYKMESQEEIITTYKYDNKEFDSKEELNNYKLLYISDNKLIELYKLFFEIPEDEGNYEEAKVPSDGSKFKMIFNRSKEGVHRIGIRRLFKTTRNQVGGIPVSEESINMIIFPNRDFKVAVETTKDTGGMFVYTSLEYKTYRIIDFINLMKELKLYIPSNS